MAVSNYTPFLADIAGTVNSLSMTGAGHYLSMIFQPIPGKTIDAIDVRCTASTSGVVDFKLESVNSGAYVPSGSLIATGAEATNVSVSANTYYANTFTTPYAVPENANNILAATVRWVSGSATFNGRYSSPSMALPRVVENAGSVTQRTATPMLTVVYSDGTRHPFAFSSISSSSTAFNSGSTPDEQGNLYVPDCNQKCVGIIAASRTPTGGTGQLRIYDADLNVLTVDAECVVDDRMGSSTSTVAVHRVFFKSPVYLIAGRTYYVTFYASNATGMYYIPTVFGDSTRRAHFSPMMYQCTRTNQTGAMSTTDTNVVLVAPIIETNYGLSRDGMTGGILG